ncbi:MAG: carbohydrate ABC transporter permease [Lachnospiraceae bacterium]|nr:carbohydrate ABC transporter permease [Lachnospiraceae bacterium]
MATHTTKVKQHKPKSVQTRIVDGTLIFLLLIIFLICAYPVWFVLVASVSNPTVVNSGKLLLLPEGFHLQGYISTLTDSRIITGYRNTIIYTVAGTLVGLFCCLTAGYSLSRRDLLGRGFIMAYMVFTTFFSGGMIATYIIVKNLGLLNTRTVMVLLGSVSVFNIIMARTFFQSTIPTELQDAAFIDGCSNTRFFVSFALPLSKAIIAVLALYLAVGYWNSYFNGLLYLTDRNLYPLQLFVREMLLLSSTSDVADGDMQGQMNQLTSVIKSAVIVISTAPIMCLYPFMQKYFVKGVMVGSLKG